MGKEESKKAAEMFSHKAQVLMNDAEMIIKMLISNGIPKHEAEDAFKPLVDASELYQELAENHEERFRELSGA